MAIIEMIPREYWRQMYEELSRIDWGHFRTDADKAQERAHERLAAEYTPQSSGTESKRKERMPKINVNGARNIGRS